MIKNQIQFCLYASGSSRLLGKLLLGSLTWSNVQEDSPEESGAHHRSERWRGLKKNGMVVKDKQYMWWWWDKRKREKIWALKEIRIWSTECEGKHSQRQGEKTWTG